MADEDRGGDMGASFSPSALDRKRSPRREMRGDTASEEATGGVDSAGRRRRTRPPKAADVARSLIEADRAHRSPHA